MKGILAVWGVVALFGISQASDVPDLQRQLAQDSCNLQDCWKNTFPKIATALQGAMNAIQAYKSGLRQELATADKYDVSEPDYEQKKLELKLQILKNYQDDCDSLRDGPMFPRQLVIAGHDLEGKNNVYVAMTVYNDVVKKTCGDASDSPDYEKCKRGVVLISDRQKWSLYNYLRLLGPGSVRSVTYAGHGAPVSLFLGPKNLLLPKDWDSRLKIGRDQWLHDNDGILYAQDLESGIGRELARVVKPGSDLSIYACNSGQLIAPKLKEVLKANLVEACLRPMHFEYSKNSSADPNNPNDWTTDWDNPIPADAKKSRMVADEPGSWGAVTVPKGGVQVPPVGAAIDDAQFSKEDRAARIILFRVAKNSSDRATVDSGKRLVVFDDADRQLLGQIFKSNIGHGDLENADQLGHEAILDAMDSAASASTDPASRDRIERLRRKLDDCVDEAVRRYY